MMLFSATFCFLFFYFFFFFHEVQSVRSESITLQLPQEDQYFLKLKQSFMACLPKEQLHHITYEKAFFHDLLFEVELLSSTNLFPWYSVKGISLDDFEIHFEKIVTLLLSPPPEGGGGGGQGNHTYLEKELSERKGFLRDILSSCPNPIVSQNRIECVLRFSLLDSACMIIAPLPFESFINVRTSIQFNPHYLWKLIAGIVLLLFAHEISKSKTFQYLSGALLFFSFGVVIIVWVVYHWIMDSKNSFSLLNNLIALLMVTSYGATVVWYLNTNFRSLLFDNWQISIAYTIVSMLVGLFSTRLARNTTSAKHLITVLVKWFLRLVGVTIIYQSFSSPRISIASSVLLAVYYLIYAGSKSLHKKFFKKE